MRYVLTRPVVLAAGRRIVRRLDPAVLRLLWSEVQRPDESALDELLPRWLDTELVVADVGARSGVIARWRRFRPHVRVVGFDPDEEECQRLTELEGEDDGASFVPVALGPVSGTAVLHLTEAPACSSLYPPIPALIRQRPELAFTEPVGTSSVVLMTLDEWFLGSAYDHIDVVKLDTQGSELGVLEGGTQALAAVRLLEIEVEFNEMYARQPLFADVDRFLRARGFVLWRLKQLVHFGLRDVPPSSAALSDSQYFDGRPHPFTGQGGQLFWGHAYYVRHEMAYPDGGAGDWQQAVRDACAATAFGFADLAISRLLQARPAAPESAAADLDRVLAATLPSR
ncbi:MAG: FkbM family methyltransferase [Actinomycetota bacterium]|nr:FkbM family methyltransferase [Actinomycetota bacterium]